MHKDLVSIADLARQEVLDLFRLALRLKAETKARREHHLLAGKTLAMIFEKPSLRTRVTFETGMTQLGGHAIYLAPADISLGKRESVPDVARNLSRWVDGVMARTFDHETVTGLAENATIPVINGLSDLEHPCQVLADFLTIHEHRRPFKSRGTANFKLAYVGDGNNVCNSLLLAAAVMGIGIAVGTPPGYEPDKDVVGRARRRAGAVGVPIEILNDPLAAVHGAHVIYTDVWASMGQESEKEARAKIFAGYQVNARMIARARKDVLVMHCLPAHRGEEITDDVLDGPHSIVLDEAENRLHAQKAVLVTLMGNGSKARPGARASKLGKRR
jgi:ornithine carbamoyltransferase